MEKRKGRPENFDPVRTTEEAKKRGSNGGKKSGESRRRKRDAKSAAKLILDMQCTDVISRNLKNVLGENSLDTDDYTNRVAIIARLSTEAMSGNVTAARTILEIAGELPNIKIENERLRLEKKRFEAEIKGKGAGNNAVDDWVDAVIQADSLESSDEE